MMRKQHRIAVITAVLLLCICYYYRNMVVQDYIYFQMKFTNVKSTTLPINSKQYLQLDWQEFKYLQHTFYANKFYFDDRAKHRGTNKVVGFISGPLINTKNMALWCLLWTEVKSGEYHVTSSIAKVTNIVITTFRFKDVRYDPYLVTCDVHDHTSTPKYVTLVDYAHAVDSVTNLLNVVIPSKNDVPTNTSKKIGICTHGMHGEVKDEEIPLLVQWFELSEMFGASKITLYNVSLTKQNKYFEKLIKYYTDSSLLEFLDFPGIPPTRNYSNLDPMNARQIVIRHALGDCFYRNLHNYWYTLHLDTDEIAVPLSCKTYAECISKFINDHPNDGEFRPGLSVKRNYNYYNVPKYEIPEISKNYPVLRYVMRTNDTLEYLGKSFLNPRECESAWEHRCFGTNIIVDVSPADMLVYHYRSGCEVALKRMCSWKNPINVRDTFLLDNYKDKIIQRTKKVLNAISWTRT